MWRLLFLFGVLGPLRATTVSIEIASPGNINASQNQNVVADGFYVGPYTLVINGVTTLGLCVDFSHQSGLGYSWSAFQTPVTSTGMNNTYVYQENAGNSSLDALTLQTYEEEVYLYRQIVSTLLPSARIAIQEAAWSITDSAFDISNNQEAQVWAAAAKNPANYGQVGLSGIYIFSDVRGINGGQQEFIADPGSVAAPVDVVPEPAALGLVAGSLGVAYIRRRHRR